MQYLELPPHPALSSHVRCYWFLQGSTDDPGIGTQSDPVLPDGRPELVLNLGDPVRHRPAGGPPRTQPATALVGQITRPFAFEPSGRVHFVGIRFNPAGAFALFGLPMHELTNDYVDAEELWPGSVELASRLFEARTPPHRQAACLDAVLRDRLARRHVGVTVTGIAARLVEEAVGRLTVDALANAVGLSGRQLGRRFRSEVGIGPKRLSRIARFQALLRCVTAAEGPALAEAALQCGYYDQAHLIRDFRELAGASPTAFLARRHPLADHFTEARLGRGV